MSNCFVAKLAMKQFSFRRNHFSLGVQNCGNRPWLSTRQQRRAVSAGHEPGDSVMRATSFILAFAFVLSASSMAGSTEGGLPGIGTFAYTGSPVAISAPLVVASR